MNKKLSSTILIIILAFAAYFLAKGMLEQKSDTPPDVYKAAPSNATMSQ